MLLKGIKTTDNDSKKALSIEKCIILAATLDFSNLYKRRLYENVLFFPRFLDEKNNMMKMYNCVRMNVTSSHFSYVKENF